MSKAHKVSKVSVFKPEDSKQLFFIATRNRGKKK